MAHVTVAERIRRTLTTLVARVVPRLWRYTGAAGREEARRRTLEGTTGVVVEFRYRPGRGGGYAPAWANPECDVNGVARRRFRMVGKSASPMFVGIPPGDVRVRVWADDEQLECAFVLPPQRVGIVSVHPRRPRSSSTPRDPRIELARRPVSGRGRQMTHRNVANRVRGECRARRDSWWLWPALGGTWGEGH